MLGVPGPKVVKNLLLLLRAAWSAQQLRHVIDEDGLEVRSVTKYWGDKREMIGTSASTTLSSHQLRVTGIYRRSRQEMLL